MKVAIIGAGNVGSTSAMRIAEKGLADVVMIDIKQGLARAKALDISDAAHITMHEFKITGTEDFSEIKDAAVVVVTAGLPRKPGMKREELLSKNKEITRGVAAHIRKYAPKSVVIVVTNPLDVMSYVMLEECGFSRKNVLGMAGDLDASRFIGLLAEKLGVKVLITPGANARGVAELAFGHILAAIRSIPFCDSAIKKEKWQRRKGIELDGKTLGLIGCGNIGKYVAKFALGFDMKVLAYDPFKDENFKPSNNFKYCGFDELISSSDIISLHCPPNTDGSALINADTICNMKDGVYIVNTARAELLNDKAVLGALDSGKIAGLTLDVFAPEPPEDWSLAKHPNVVSTAHVGGFTTESVDRAVGMAVDNLINELKK